MSQKKDLSAITAQYEEAGLIVIKLSESDLLDGDKLIKHEHIVNEFPDRQTYFSCLKEAYLAQFKKEGIELLVDPDKITRELTPQDTIKKFTEECKFPEGLNLAYSRLPMIRGKVPYDAFIHMLTQYKDGLEQRMRERGFSDTYMLGTALLSDEILINGFKHGNQADISQGLVLEEIYMRGSTRHGYILIARDSGVSLFTREMIEAHNTPLDNTTGTVKRTTSKRGFVIVSSLSDQAWVLPYELGNNVAVLKFEDLQH